MDLVPSMFGVRLCFSRGLRKIRKKGLMSDFWINVVVSWVLYSMISYFIFGIIYIFFIEGLRGVNPMITSRWQFVVYWFPGGYLTVQLLRGMRAFFRKWAKLGKKDNN